MGCQPYLRVTEPACLGWIRLVHQDTFLRSFATTILLSQLLANTTRRLRRMLCNSTPRGGREVGSVLCAVCAEQPRSGTLEERGDPFWTYTRQGVHVPTMGLIQAPRGSLKIRS